MADFAAGLYEFRNKTVRVDAFIMNIAEYLESAVFRKNGPLTLLIMAPLFLGYLLLYPNLTLHYSEFTKYFIKYPVMVSIFLVAFILGARAVGYYWPLIVILTLFIFNFMLVQTSPSFQYATQAVVLILLAGMFYRHPSFISLYFKIAIALGVIYGIQTVIVFIYWVGAVLGMGMRIPIENVVFQGEGAARLINIYLGNNGWVNVAWWAGFRATSYFSEAARYANFLTPLLYMAGYLKGHSRYYTAAFYIIALSLLLTFSIAAFASIFVTFFLFRYNTLPKKVKFIFQLLFLLIPVFFLTYMLFPDYWQVIFDKSGSASTRFAGITSLMEAAYSHQTGCDMNNVICAALEPKASMAPLFWLVFSGFQGLFLMLLMVGYFVISVLRLINSGGELERALGYGGIAVLLEQTWYGNYLEFPFIVFIAILMALSTIRRKLTHRFAAER